jgi:hypothetical protein
MTRPDPVTIASFALPAVLNLYGAILPPFDHLAVACAVLGGLCAVATGWLVAAWLRARVTP